MWLYVAMVTSSLLINIYKRIIIKGALASFINVRININFK